MNQTFVKRTSFTKLPIGELDVPAGKVQINLYINAATFAATPYTLAEFTGFVTNYTAKYAAYKNGGATAKAEYMMAEETLLNAMNTTALYVDNVADGERAIVILSGFEPTKESNTPKSKPTEMLDVELERGATGEITATCAQQEGVDVYIGVLTAEAPAPAWFVINGDGQVNFGNDPYTPPTPSPMPQSSGGLIDFNKSRKKLFMGLTPGVTYYVTFFGINSAGVGPISATVSIVCY